MDKKQKTMEKTLNEKDMVVEDLGKQIYASIKLLEEEEHESVKKIEILLTETLQDTVGVLNKCVAEKDEYIVNLDNRLSKLEQVDNNHEKETTETIPVYFNCSKCAFESKSKKGLNIHIKRKHNNFSKEKFPQNCDLCEKEMTNSKELKKHMKTHSYSGTFYSRSGYKCEFCDFNSKTVETMEVHIGKCENEIFPCGLCDFSTSTGRPIKNRD